MPHGGARPGAGRKKKDGGNSERKHFSAQEIEIMLDSPHIAYVSRTTVSFTVAFKEMFWQRYCDGITPVKIFEDAGLNVDVIGKARIDTLVKSLRDQIERGLPFNDGLERHYNKPDKTCELPKQPRYPKNAQIPLTPEAIAKMVHKVAYLEQEMEFLKKLILAGTVKK
jgi:hypothetical protein